MPIYEFECRQCGAVLEKLIRDMAEIEELICPKCAGPELEQKISAFSSPAKSGGSSCAPGGG